MNPVKTYIAHIAKQEKNIGMTMEEVKKLLASITPKYYEKQAIGELQAALTTQFGQKVGSNILLFAMETAIIQATC